MQLLLENEILKAAILDLRLGNSSAAKALLVNSDANVGSKAILTRSDMEDADYLSHVPRCLDHMSG